jgi:8-oxo-dGTP pyrophosphatase MutT (NUDIX family)
LTAESWRGLPDEGCAGSGARLVRLLEETRLACASTPTPLRVVRAVTAVIKAPQGTQDVYLMQYDQKARQFQPIGGKQEAFDADGVAALTRELCEELNIAALTPGQDFVVYPLTQNVQVSEVSASVHVVTRYDHSFYHLTDIRFALPIDSSTRWITADEMAAGRTTDGLAITSLFEDYLPGILPTLGYSL